MGAIKRICRSEAVVQGSDLVLTCDAGACGKRDAGDVEGAAAGLREGLRSAHACQESCAGESSDKLPAIRLKVNFAFGLARRGGALARVFGVHWEDAPTIHSILILRGGLEDEIRIL